MLTTLSTHPARPGRQPAADHRRQHPDDRRDGPASRAWPRPGTPSTRSHQAQLQCAGRIGGRRGSQQRPGPGPGDQPHLRPGGVRRRHQPGQLPGPAQQPQRPAARPHHPGPVRARARPSSSSPPPPASSTGSSPRRRSSTTPARSPSATSSPTTTTAPPTAPITLPTAITVSSDNFFNTIGLNLWYGRAHYGDDALQNVAKEYGLGSPTGIALPNEAAGQDPHAGVLHQGPPGRSQRVHPGPVVSRATATRSPSARTRCW